MSNVSIKEVPGQLMGLLAHIRRYIVLLVLVVVLGVYGFLVLRTTSLQNVQPSSGSAKATPVVTPHIDPKVVQQLQQLQDNSVSVKTLFDQARSNPFQE